jgi:large subunit ribosomal protein L20
MIRITNSSLKRHKKILKAASGFIGSRKNFKTAKEAVRNAKFQVTESRKKIKRNIKQQIWIPRINSFARMNFNISYNKFINYSPIKDKKILTQMINNNEDMIISLINNKINNKND